MKKLLSFLVAAVVLSLSFTTAYAAVDTENEKSSTVKSETMKNEAQYKSFTGTVKDIKASDTQKDVSYVLVENAEGTQVNFLISKDTYHINDENIGLGSQVTGYYDANAMTIMIYPPQYEAKVILVKNQALNIKVDHFDKDLVSADGMLKLNISKETEVILENGTKFTGDLSNRKLVVFYDVSTKSIPAQTSPIKVVVLSEAELPDDEHRAYYGSFTGTVKELIDLDAKKGSFKITVENKDGEEANFTVSEETYRTNDEKIKVGSVVTGYYDAKIMMIMIYPMQYMAEVIDVQTSNHNIKVDYFDQKLISSDGTLKLSIDKKTEVILQDGSSFKGNPIKRNLVVIYDTSTKSIPAQTTPIKVIVLSDKDSKEVKQWYDCIGKGIKYFLQMYLNNVK